MRVVTPTTAPLTKGETRATADPINLGEFEAAVNSGQTNRFLVDHFHANQWFPKMQISGATVSFSVPKLSAVVRSEFAYFYAEPFFLNSAPNQILGPALTGECYSRLSAGGR